MIKCINCSNKAIWHVNKSLLEDYNIIHKIESKKESGIVTCVLRDGTDIKSDDTVFCDDCILFYTIILKDAL